MTQAHKCQSGAIKVICLDTPQNSSLNSIPTTDERGESLQYKCNRIAIMKNNFMPNKISRDKVIKKGYHTENFAKNLRNCSSETKKAFKKTLNNKIMHKKSMNTDTLDQNCSRMEEISIENQSKVAPTKSKLSSNDQAKIKHKNRKKRILTE